MYFVYVLQSIKNRKKYVGFTEKDPKQRLIEHNNGSNSWTRDNGPFELMYYERFHCEKDAKSRELFYKTGIGRRVRDAIVIAVNKRV